MRRGIIKSELIKTIGHSGNTLEVEYADGKIFQYMGVPLKVFASIVRAKHPGRKLLEV
jgi:hypothetical protein